MYVHTHAHEPIRAGMRSSCLRSALALVLTLHAASALRVPPPRLHRRAVLAGAALAPALALVAAPVRPAAAKLVADSKSRFVIGVPDGFVQSKRSATTGTLFVAGDFPRSAVLSVTGWPVRALLEADANARNLPGLPAEPTAPVGPPPAALQDLGSASTVARLLLRNRDRETSSGALTSELLDARFESDGCLRFSFLTPLPVADPDALEKERGIRELKRRSSAVSFLVALGSEGPAVVSAWGSALSQDWETDLGTSIEQAVGAFSWTPPAP